MPNTFRNIAVVSMSTVGSRVLGLLRDILIFAALGASLWNSAFLLAFTLPNLFRRLFGEGALTSAVVPVFSDVLERGGKSEAFHFFNQVLLRVLVLLLGVVVCGIVVLACLSGFGLLEGRWRLGSDLAVVLMPYMLFICTAAIVSAGLNVLERFAAAAITPIFLNLSMILSLLIAWFLGSKSSETVYWLCGGVLVGGVLQLALPVWDLIKQGWRPALSTESSPDVDRVRELFLPGLMGAAILQINILVSRLLAYTLDDSSVSILYLASRLMELPLGVFTVSVATVFFPILARAVSTKNKSLFADSFNQGLRLIFAITIPAGIGLIVLAEPILALLFQWGAFGYSDVVATIPLLIIYGVGLPLYSAATFATRGLHARKDMKTPVQVAALCLLTNAVFGYILMQFWGAAGLALGNVLAALVQASLLWHALSKSVSAVRLDAILFSVAKSLLSAVIMAVLCWGGLQWMKSFEIDAKVLSALQVFLLLPISIAIYFGLLTLFRFEELEQMKMMIRRKLFPSK